MLTKGDFHNHSTASDGYLKPSELATYAKKQGIDTIALTDHNTIEGIPEAAEAASQHGISLIPGVELSTKYKGQSVHILGYFRDTSFNQDTFQEGLKLIRNHRFKEVRRLLCDFIPLEGSGGYLTIGEGINFLTAFNCSVVLAHPVRINKNILMEVLNFPFQGIEAKYCWNTPSDTDFFIKTALTKFQFYTGGSDFHTNIKDGQKHCLIGEPFLDALEIRIFLRNSGVLVFNEHYT